MNYIVLETQTNAGITAIVPPTIYTDEAQAKRAYHLAVASAVISNVEVHSIILMTTEGHILIKEVCRHSAEEINE